VLYGWRFPAEQRAVDVQIPLDRAGSLEVSVTGGKGPLAGARVTVRSEGSARWWEGPRTAPAPGFTGREGVARFEGLAAGYYTVVVEAPGLLVNESRRIAVRRGERTPVPVHLVRPASLSGFVRLADGSGVEGLSVLAHGPTEAMGTSGPDGGFALGDLAAGRYRLEVRHEGFEQVFSKEPIALREGESRDGLALVVAPRAPELAFVLQREVFVPDAPMKVGLRSFRLGYVDLVLDEILLPRLLDPASDFRALAQGADTSGLVRVQAWRHVPADGPPYSWRDEEATLPAGLKPGAYLLRGRAGALERRAIFFVSELGLLVKRSTSRMLVSAASLTGGQPVAGVVLYLVANEAQADRPAWVWSPTVDRAGTPAGGTDERGLAQLALAERTARVRVVAVSATHGLAVAEAPLAPAAEQGGDQVFLYTDRPIYRPGQTVHWKAFARQARAGGYAVPDATTASLSLDGPDGAMLPLDVARLSPRGSAEGSIELPRDLPLGEWALHARAGTAAATAGFAVEEYRKPEFRVEVTPDREVYVNGDEVRFVVAASYFFGAPVFGAAVRYNLFESRLRDPDEWGEEAWQERGFGRVLKTGETRTDLDGRAALVFTPERVSYDRRLTLEVEVVDASSRAVAGRGSAVMGRGLFTVHVRPASHLMDVGKPVTVEVTTKDHVGKGVAAAVTVELDQEAWNPLERRYTRAVRPLATATVTTDALGHAVVSLTPVPARSGQLVIRAQADDAKGNRITAQSSCWVYDPQVFDYAYRYPALEAFADRERYQPGDTARILVNTEVRNATVLVSVEGRELYEHRLLGLAGNSGLVAVPIRADYAPNVFVALHVRKGKEVHSRTLELPVEAARHDLVIALEPDKTEARPGDTTRVTVRTRDAKGAPVAAEVSLGVVDEAIYSLRADDTPHPHDVFYGRRPNWVTTVVSWPVLYYGGADKGGRAEVRKDFRDVAFWTPTVLTGAEGRAEVGFRYPDNLTTWRLTSRGVGEATLVGQAVAKTLVTKEVVARLAGPRFFVAGDEASLVSVVNNRSPAPVLGVEETIEAQGASVTGPATRRADLAANGESRGEWRVSVPREPPREGTPEALFTFRARSKADSDALQVRVPVVARAVALRPHGAGVLEGRSATVIVTLPSDLVRPGSELRLELSPSSAAMCLAASDYLTGYPWGCTEQTANAILPAVALLGALEPAGVVLPGWEQPTRRLTPFLDHLRALQGQDGGWGWWQEEEADPYLTVLALDALARATRFGVGGAAAAGPLQQGYFALVRRLSEVRTSDGEAYVLAHLLSLQALENAEQRFPELKQNLENLALSVYGARDRLGTAGLALAARAHADLGKAEQAKALLGQLVSRAVTDGAGLHWSADPEAGYGWFGDEVENTAYALSAMQAVTPQDSRGATVVRWLASKRRGSYWRCTRTTAPVAIALAEYLKAHVAEAKPSYRLRVEWNGETLLDHVVGPADAFGSQALRVEVPGTKLRPGDNRLVVTREGTGAVYWGWEAKAQVPSPGPDTSNEKRLAVTREYLRAERATDRRGRPQYLVSALEPGQAFHVGESVMVRLTLRASRALAYLVLEDPRAAGFEVDKLRPEGAAWPYGTHAEERDQRVAFFLDRVEEGETVIEYLMRPELDGAFTVLPASAGGMYDPDLLVRSGEAKLTVAAK
jgi:uncharacterized protein YfaS (alpha-2-macroglobulin family)